jgi:hypothetical protein
MTVYIAIDDVVLRIPSGWDAFVFNGVLYKRRDDVFVAQAEADAP